MSWKDLETRNWQPIVCWNTWEGSNSFVNRILGESSKKLLWKTYCKKSSYLCYWKLSSHGERLDNFQSHIVSSRGHRDTFLVIFFGFAMEFNLPGLTKNSFISHWTHSNSWLENKALACIYIAYYMSMLSNGEPYYGLSYTMGSP